MRWGHYTLVAHEIVLYSLSRRDSSGHRSSHDVCPPFDPLAYHRPGRDERKQHEKTYNRDQSRAGNDVVSRPGEGDRRSGRATSYQGETPLSGTGYTEARRKNSVQIFARHWTGRAFAWHLSRKGRYSW